MMIQKTRRWVQTFSLLLLHSSWSPALQLKWFCAPVLSCHSCALAWFACPMGIFVHYSGWHVLPYLTLGLFLLLAALLGRLLCGWVCPFGFLQDLLHKIPTPKLSLPAWTTYIKYLVLLLTIFTLPWFFGAETLWSFCRVCPASALQVTIPNLIGGAAISLATAIKLGVLVLVLLLVLFFERGFCRVLCPLGAMLAPFNHVSLWSVSPAKFECLKCEKCNKVCPMEGKPSERFRAGVPASRALDCVVCHECQTVCVQRGPKPRTPRSRPQAPPASRSH